ncbi:uncharacterized protein [Montipora capricornis]|uniref:uncharacterized protein isoform X2 n=1 Tax=Montipora capricornis TaxID=246305 RepID=UPI0035F11940
MARSKSFFDDIKKELECSVCQEQFSEANEPKILKCLHTFCKNCLEAWLRKQRNGELSCPSCRHITHCDNNDIQRLPSNLFCKQLVEIVEAYGGQGQEDSPPCGNCDERRHLKFYCSNCNFFLCEDCARFHKKVKPFKGHEIKEIGNFESGDLQDYSRRANVCKYHQDENRFFCVKCGICICRDCAILEHQDHKKISLEQGIESNELEIEAKMREVRANRTRLITFRGTLEERKLKQGSDIEEATKEVKRVAERCMLLIRQHEASVTEKLLKQNVALRDAFSAQMNILDGKVMEIDNTLAFCEEVLQRKNLPEILNVKTMIEERLRELSLTMELENLPKLDSSRVKYVPSDFEFVTYAPGKLLISNTEPLKSVAEGKGFTEGRVGDVRTFTVITKDCNGKTTYSELDEVKVAIKLKSRQQNENLEPTNSQDGRYSVSYKPTTQGEYAVSININDIAIKGSPFILEVKEKLRDGAISSVLQHVWKCDDAELTVKPYLEAEFNGEVFDFAVVTAELCMDYVNYLSREETAKLLEEVKAKIGVSWIKSAESFSISGTLRQIEEALMVLEKGMYLANGIEVVSDHEMKNDATSQPQKNHVPQPLEDDNDVEMDVDQNHMALPTRDQANGRPGRTEEWETDQGAPSKSHSFESQSFEVQPKIVKAVVKAHKKELDDIETEFGVVIPRKAEGNKIAVIPMDACSAENYEKACDLFTTLYQKTFQLFKVERFSVKGVSKTCDDRATMTRIAKEFPVSIEKSKDQKQWEMYGEASHIEKALSFLTKEGVELERDSKKITSGRSKGGKMALGGDGADHFVTYQGRVKLSVYKADITNETVDVIVNASDRFLSLAGGVGKAIVDKGGKSIENESREISRKRGSLKDGEAVATESGNLPCKVVVHVVGPELNVHADKKRKILRCACLNSLLKAQKLNMTSIALPAIGSGNCGMAKDICAKVMCDAVDEFSRQGNAETKTITDIRFVNTDDSSVLAFSNELKTRYGDDSVKHTSGGGSSKSGIPRSDRGRNRKTSNSSNGETHSPSEQSFYSSYDNRKVFGQSSSKSDSFANTLKNNGNDSSHPVTEHSLGPTSSVAVHGHPLSFLSQTSPPGGSYSNALKRNTACRDASPRRTQQPAASGGKKGSEEEECPICLTAISNPRSLKCKHVFCSACIETALNVRNKCPVCQKPQGVLKGNQPPGVMTSRVSGQSLPGYEGYGSIIIEYSFLRGIQGSEHPNPGQYYEGTHRQAYLPDTREGREVLQLLRRAFDARLVFTVGTSTISGFQNQITWNDIHHKTSKYGGPIGFGYPDLDYLRRVKEELADKGIH